MKYNIRIYVNFLISIISLHTIPTHTLLAQNHFIDRGKDGKTEETTF